MPIKELTDRTVKAEIKKPVAKGERRLVMDAQVRAFGLMVTDSGAASYIVTLRFPGTKSTSRRSLGRVGEISLAEARDKARTWKALVARGIDPQGQEDKERRERDRRRANTVTAVAEDFIAAMPVDERKRDEVARDIRREIVGAWGSRAVADLTPRDVIELVKAIRDRGAPHQARNVLGYARRMFTWAILQHAYGIDRSPCEPVKPKAIIGRKLARKRVLSDEELRAAWSAGESLGYPYGPLFRLLILTGARKSEIAEARWSEIDLDRGTLTIPADRQKSAEAHVIPLGPLAFATLRALPRFEGAKGTGYLFSTTGGRTCVDGFSKAKNRLDAAMAAALDVKAVEPFVIHDLRRTMRTHLSALPIPQHVAERIIGHAQPGLIQTYDRFAFEDEKRRGLELWEERLSQIVEPADKPGPRKVLPLWKTGGSAAA